MKHTISALVENKFGVLARVAGMFSGRGFNIGSFVERELVLVKVKADSKTRAEIVQTADLFHARVVHVDKQALIIQCTGNPNKMAAFMNMIEPFGIIDMARTGNLALSRFGD